MTPCLCQGYYAAALVVAVVAIVALLRAEALMVKAWHQVGAWRAYHIRRLREQQEWHEYRWRKVYGTPPLAPVRSRPPPLRRPRKRA